MTAKTNQVRPRRLSGLEEWFWYLLAGTSYILLGIWHKWMLNWFLGPAWLVAIVVFGPRLADRVANPWRSGSRE